MGSICWVVVGSWEAEERRTAERSLESPGAEGWHGEFFREVTRGSQADTDLTKINKQGEGLSGSLFHGHH